MRVNETLTLMISLILTRKSMIDPFIFPININVNDNGGMLSG